MRTFLFIIASALFALLPSAAAAASDTTDLEQALFDATNADRLAVGLGPVELDQQTLPIALRRASDQIGREMPSHDIENGVPEAFRLIGHPEQQYLGENLAAFGPAPGLPADTTSSIVERAFMASPDHRDNVLLPQFTRLSIGVVIDADGRLYFAELFRGPASGSGQIP